MMLALTVVDDIFDNDEFLVIFLEGHAQYVTGIHFISGKNLLIHPGHPGRGFE
ncbi:hypothetical protein D3C81_1205080 [compost metagenome]